MRIDKNILGVLLALLIVLGIPFLFRPDAARVAADAKSLVIITPHNEQIRSEFAGAFSNWYRDNYNEDVIIDWRTPGGTSDIRKQLVAEYESAAKNNTLDHMSYDLIFGGGSYEHIQLSKPNTVIDNNGNEVTYSITQAVEFSPQQLDQWYGPNEIGRNTLYDPELHWFGTALSAFGIVFNRDVLHDLGVSDPQTWSDLTNPQLASWVALADPGQSGSICTTYEVILERTGWQEGWRILKESAANSRYFANSSSKIPIDVSLGEAAVGLCIDFYGRYQSQSIADAGDKDRVGYIDPPRVSDIDPDPISMLTGSPHAEQALRFIEFCLTEQAQSLWQFPAVDEAVRKKLAGKGLPTGPVEFELRRMPSRRIMYDKYLDKFVDKVNPFDLAEPVDHWDYNIRSFIAPLFSSMAIDNHEYLKQAWKAIQKLDIHDKSQVELKSKMLQLFHSMPTIKLTDGTVLSLQSTQNLKQIKDHWKNNPQAKTTDRIKWTIFFRENYKHIIEMADNNT